VDHNGKVYLPYLHDWQPLCRILKEKVHCIGTNYKINNKTVINKLSFYYKTHKISINSHILFKCPKI